MGETTVLIQKRIRHWKTTAAGIAGIVCPIIALFCPPDIALKILSASAALSGAGLIAAADAKSNESVKPV